MAVLALVGPARGARLRVFLLALAVTDDIGALIVIALRYTAHLHLLPLLWAAVGVAAIAGLRRLQAWRGVGYAVVSVATWLATYLSGIAPTLAGVVIALILPVYPPRRTEVEEAGRLATAFRQSPNPEYARAARQGIDRAVSVNERLMRLHEPYTGFVIVPLFALANAGVRVSEGALAQAIRSPITWGVVAGLVVGKFLGITGTTLLAARLRGNSPFGPGFRRTWLAGGAALSGIGFTIALFIIQLALPDPRQADQARIGVLAATVLATAIGSTVFALDRRLRPCSIDEAEMLVRPVDSARDHIRGPVDAPLTIIEYGDFECPFCSKATGSLAQVRAHFGDELRYVFRHMPLEQHHPSARRAALASEAAARQGRFWEMHDLMFAHHDELSPDNLREYASRVGLDTARFDEDIRHGKVSVRVDDDAIDAGTAELSGTPTFYLGVADTPPRRHHGPHDAATLIANLTTLRNAGVQASSR
jgi:Na+/H+ antiporter NhaA